LDFLPVHSKGEQGLEEAATRERISRALFKRLHIDALPEKLGLEASLKRIGTTQTLIDCDGHTVSVANSVFYTDIVKQ
jgi:hypothetical protein